jgi:hypothetical protein
LLYGPLTAAQISLPQQRKVTMTIRKRDDSVKRGCGVDGRLGEDYTKDHAFNDVNLGYSGNREVDPTDDIKGREITRATLPT